MNINPITLSAITLVLSTSVNASLIDNATFTTDTRTGLDWLDLTQTQGIDYNGVSAGFGLGGRFEGWGYATTAQVSELLNSAGGNGTYNGWSAANNGVALPLMGLWGTLDTANGIQQSYFIMADGTSPGQHWTGLLRDVPFDPLNATQDYIAINDSQVSEGFRSTIYGSALIRVSTIPIPASVWLFGSGLIGLFGVARRKMCA